MVKHLKMAADLKAQLEAPRMGAETSADARQTTSDDGIKKPEFFWKFWKNLEVFTDAYGPENDHEHNLFKWEEEGRWEMFCSV